MTARPALRRRPRASWRGALPFASGMAAGLPTGRLLRLSLFQASVGMALVLLNGTLNRVMVIEFGMPASLVAAMLGLPLLVAPFRALIGFRSDHHRSVIGWRRVPYLWIGTLLQFGGLALMPFALLILADGDPAKVVAGRVALAAAFLFAGVGLHTVQTAGLALATDLAPASARPRVVTLLYVALLAGMAASGVVFGALLADFSPIRLIRVIHGAALATLLLNLVGVWQQEGRTAQAPGAPGPRPSLRRSWAELDRGRRPARLLVALALGMAGFGMGDVLLEPYGGAVFGLSVSGTTLLSALMAAGALLGCLACGRLLARGWEPPAAAALGALAGVPAFAAVVFAAPLGSLPLLGLGTVAVGFGSGLFAAGTLGAAMALGGSGRNGLALGAWGAVQATAAGLATAAGGSLRDLMGHLGSSGALGPALPDASAGYSFVYHVEIGLLFATLVAIGPLVRVVPPASQPRDALPGLARLPG